MSDAECLREFQRVLDDLDPAAPPRAVFVRRALKGPGKALGVMSASFNPPTRAHLRMAEMTRQAFALDETLLLLAKTNVDKELYGAPLEARLSMMDALASARPGYSVAAVNRARFVDKLKALRPLYPSGPTIRFIVGYDTLVRLFDPKYYSDTPAELEQMFESCRFVAFNREADDRETVHRFLKRPECQAFADRIDVMELDPLYAAMSSSEARKRLRNGEVIDALVPEEAERVIRRIGLYK